MKFWGAINSAGGINGNDGYVDGNPGTGTQGSIPTFRGFEQTLRELQNLVKAAGLTPSDTLNDSQVWQAVLRGVTFADTSGGANAITVPLPAGVPAVPAGVVGFQMSLKVKLANTNTSTTVNLNVFATGNVRVKGPDGNDPQVGDLIAGRIYTFAHDGTNWRVLYGVSAAVTQILSQVAMGAFANKHRNATCQIAERGTSVTVTAGAGFKMTLDGHMVSCTGADVTVTQAAGNSGARAPNGIRITGQAGVTNVKHCMVIESVDSSSIAGKRVVDQTKLLNNSGGAFAPTLTIKHPTTVDTGATAWNAAVTDVNAAALQSCPNGSMTQLGWAGTAHADVGNGLATIRDFGGALNGVGKNVILFDFDIREAIGDLNNLPIPELRSYSVERLQCQRYLPSYNSSPYLSTLGNANQIVDGGAGVMMVGLNPDDAYVAFAFPSLTRTNPTGITVSAASHFGLGSKGGGVTNLSSMHFISAGYKAGELGVILSSTSGFAAGESTLLFAPNTAARLIWTGAEITGSAI